jgi:hypothetical protein
MSPKKEAICFEMVVNKHTTEDSADKNPVYKVLLKPKTSQKIGDSEATVTMTIKSESEEIFDLLPVKSERQVTLQDEQTTLA